jgi:chromate transporter
VRIGNAAKNSSPAARRLEVVSAFLKIGALGYGPAAIWGLIQSEVQERRAWLSKERFLEGMALVNALPGAPAKLRDSGFDAKYVNSGHSGWKAIGHPVRMEQP